MLAQQCVMISSVHTRAKLLVGSSSWPNLLTLKVLVATIDAQWEGMGDVGSARYEPVLLPPCPTTRVLSYSNSTFSEIQHCKAKAMWTADLCPATLAIYASAQACAHI